MKAVFVMSDSFRRDHLGAYGNDWVHTPYLDRLAGISHVFESAYNGSFPTGPNRRDIHVGKGHHPGHAFNPWTNIRDEEVTMAARLSGGGVHTMMITDVANGATRGANMFKGFSHYTVNRGQEGDPYSSDGGVPLEMPVPHELIRYPASLYHRVLMNRAHRRVEEDYFAPGTFKTACEWLERNWKRDDFLLWIETFDPHEPWDPPQWYIDRYDAGYDGRVLECPPYGFYRRLGITEREVRHIQARYAAECTMVDNAVGRLFATLEKLSLLDETAIFFTTDHGIYAGHKGDACCVGKPWFVGPDGGWLVAGRHHIEETHWLPLRTGLIRLPLLIKLPGQTEGRRVERIAQPWDLHPTLLELFDVPVPDELQGDSLLSAINGKAGPARSYAFNGYIHNGVHMAQAANANWIYSCWPGGEREPSLIDLRNDPDLADNLAAEHPEVCRRMHDALAVFNPAPLEGTESP
ncbi:MAG: sulfatase [Planctomycetota bacterium]